MTDREKVIAKLQILRTWCAVNPEYNKGLCIEDCRSAVEWLDNALALLKKSFTPEEVYKTVIEHGQHDKRFKLGDKIDYTFMDVVGILNTELMCKAGDM